MSTVDSTADGSTFEAWYRRSWPVLQRVLTVSTGDLDLAEDVASEAFTRAFTKWSQVQHMESPDRWVTTVAFNLVRSRWRRDRIAARWRAGHRPPAVSESAPLDPELWDAVERLPPRARQVVSLRYVLDCTQAEIAEILAIAPGTVASTLHSARRTLVVSLTSRATHADTEVSHHGR